MQASTTPVSSRLKRFALPAAAVLAVLAVCGAGANWLDRSSREVLAQRVTAIGDLASHAFAGDDGGARFALVLEAIRSAPGLQRLVVTDDTLRILAASSQRAAGTAIGIAYPEFDALVAETASAGDPRVHRDDDGLLRGAVRSCTDHGCTRVFVAGDPALYPLLPVVYAQRALVTLGAGCLLVLLVFSRRLRTQLREPLARLVAGVESVQRGAQPAMRPAIDYGYLAPLALAFERASQTVLVSAREAERDRQRFRLLINTVPNALIVADATGIIREMNTAAEELFGYRRDELAGQRIEMLMPAHIAAAHPAYMRGAASQNTQESAVRWSVMGAGRELSARRADGSEVRVEIALGSMRGTEGLEFVAEFTDITPRLAAAEQLRQSMREAQREHQRFRMLFHTVPNALLVADATGAIRDVNTAAEELFGYGRDELIGREISVLMPTDIARHHGEYLRRAVDGHAEGESVRWTVMGAGRELSARRADGSEVRVEIALGSMRGEHGLEFVAEFTDVTPRLVAAQRLRLVELAFSNTGEAICVTDPHNRIIEANPALARLTGVERGALVGRALDRVLAACQAAGGEPLDVTAAHAPEWRGELRVRGANGGALDCEVAVDRIFDDDGTLQYHVWVISNISAHKRLMAQLETLAYYDSVTRLPNRALFADRLQHAIAVANRSGVRGALMMLDLDRFKEINDTLGHAVGDEVLQCIGERLRRRLRSSDTLCRLGGDEFAVILPEIGDPAHASTIADELIECMREPLAISGHSLRVSCSVGVSLFPDDGTDPDVLVRNSDLAMYQAKNDGKARWHFFSAGMDSAIRRRVEIEALLRGAVEREELFLVYQPKINLRSGEVCGVEALARWLSPELGPVPPSEFIPIAEESDLILSLGEWLIGQVCRDLRALDAAGVHLPGVAVNISARELRDPELAARIARQLEHHRVDPGRIELEVTETMVMNDYEMVTRKMDRLRGLGLRLAIDDFGTGYSSLARLKRFPVSTLKIDRSFVSDLPQDRDDAVIVKLILALAAELGMSVVAEGIETEEQAAFLRVSGCTQGQGYLYGRPMGLRDLLARLDGCAGRAARAGGVAAG